MRTAAWAFPCTWLLAKKDLFLWMLLAFKTRSTIFSVGDGSLYCQSQLAALFRNRAFLKDISAARACGGLGNRVQTPIQLREPRHIMQLRWARWYIRFDSNLRSVLKRHDWCETVPISQNDSLAAPSLPLSALLATGGP